MVPFEMLAVGFHPRKRGERQGQRGEQDQVPQGSAALSGFPGLSPKLNMELGMANSLGQHGDREPGRGGGRLSCATLAPAFVS